VVRTVQPILVSFILSCEINLVYYLPFAAVISKVILFAFFFDCILMPGGPGGPGGFGGPGGPGGPGGFGPGGFGPGPFGPGPWGGPFVPLLGGPPGGPPIPWCCWLLLCCGLCTCCIADDLEQQRRYQQYQQQQYPSQYPNQQYQNQPYQNPQFQTQQNTNMNTFPAQQYNSNQTVASNDTQKAQNYQSTQQSTNINTKPYNPSSEGTN